MSLLEKTRQSEKAPVYPTKRTINFVPEKERLTWTPRLIGATIIGIILILLFAKFAVIDVINRGLSADQQLSQKQAQLTALQEENSDYEKLQLQVAQLGAGGLSVEERSLPNRLEVISLVSNTLSQRTDVQSVSVIGSTMEIQFLNASLNDVSSVVSALEASSLVTNVALETSKSSSNSGVISTVKVELASSTPGYAPVQERSLNTGVSNG